MKTAVKTVRCAIYTRKSTEENLELDFNSLDAQREAAEAYIASQKSQGWTCLNDRYDDGGFSGGTVDRPAFQRLMADVQAGKVDCIMVYKIDRLSRSLLDFSKIMEVLDRHSVSLVSVTQQFNTTTSMGRLTLNILLSFAQFEREIISERTRDKIAAARRKGKWSGGPPILGYDIERPASGSRLVVNPQEAKLARQIFDLYLEMQSLIATVRELHRRGWTAKTWTNRKGDIRGGRPFDKSTLFKMLTNVTYLGKVTHKGAIYKGEHEAIIDEDVFGRVQTMLRRNRRMGRRPGADGGGLLRSLVRCKSCGCAMSHTFTAKGKRRYRYYVCGHAQKNGWDACPAPSLPAGELEQFVVDQIKQIGKDPDVIRDTIGLAQQQTKADIEALALQRADLQREAKDMAAKIGQFAAAAQNDNALAGPLSELQDQLRNKEQRITVLNEQTIAAQGRRLDDDEWTGAIEAFEPLWDSLSPAERARIVHLLVQRVEYDGENEAVAITFHPAGIKALAAQEISV